MLKKNISIFFSFFLVSLLPLLVSLSPSPSIVAKEYERDGFMFRFLLGRGESNFNYDTQLSNAENLDTYNLSTPANLFMFQFGKSPESTKNITVYLSTFFSIRKNIEIRDPNIEFFKFLYSSSSYGIGMGITYHLPYNISISPEYKNAIFTQYDTSIDYPNNKNESYTFSKAKLQGHGIGITITKDFWIDKDITLGIAFFFTRDEVKETERQIREKKDDPYQVFDIPASNPIVDYENLVGFGLSLSYH